MNPQNIYSDIPSNLTQEVFEQMVKTKHVKIERIISKGQQSPKIGWHDQEKNEWVIVLKGKATLFFEDETYLNLHEGDYINIPAHTKHKVTWTDPDAETVWLAVHY